MADVLWQSDYGRMIANAIFARDTLASAIHDEDTEEKHASAYIHDVGDLQHHQPGCHCSAANAL